MCRTRPRNIANLSDAALLPKLGALRHARAGASRWSSAPQPLTGRSRPERLRRQHVQSGAGDAARARACVVTSNRGPDEWLAPAPRCFLSRLLDRTGEAQNARPVPGMRPSRSSTRLISSNLEEISLFGNLI